MPVIEITIAFIFDFLYIVSLSKLYGTKIYLYLKWNFIAYYQKESLLFRFKITPRIFLL